MEHFYHLTDSPNWFTSPQFYKKFVASCPANGTIVEVGCWKGRSSAFLVVEAINANKNIKIYCVDTWLGNDEIPVGDRDMENKTVYEKFMLNMKPVVNHFTPLRMPSLEACKTFQDGSLDIVFIDASHHYEDVKNDIIAWLPKVKSGGILAGHDLGTAFTGVDKAVKEVLPNYKAFGEQCWGYLKP